MRFASVSLPGTLSGRHVLNRPVVHNSCHFNFLAISKILCLENEVLYSILYLQALSKNGKIFGNGIMVGVQQCIDKVKNDIQYV